MDVVYAFAAWTLFVWGNRISNIIGDDASSGTSSVVDLGAAVVMVVLGVAVVVGAWRGRPAWALPALVVATVVTWAVRVPLLLAGDEWSVAFEVVHIGLAVVSLSLAYGAGRSRARAAARFAAAAPPR